MLATDAGVPTTTIALGAALIVLGLGGYVLTGAVSLTALIPAAFGVLFVLVGVLARDDRKRMHAMHAAVVIALLGFLGSFRGLQGLGKVFDGTAVRPAIVAQTIMALLTLGYIVIAVRWFHPGTQGTPRLTYIVNRAAIVVMARKKWPRRRFSFSSCWLLSKLTVGTSTAGKPSASMNGAIGTVPPSVRRWTGGAPKRPAIAASGLPADRKR